MAAPHHTFHQGCSTSGRCLGIQVLVLTAVTLLLLPTAHAQFPLGKLPITNKKTLSSCMWTGAGVGPGGLVHCEPSYAALLEDRPGNGAMKPGDSWNWSFDPNAAASAAATTDKKPTTSISYSYLATAFNLASTWQCNQRSTARDCKFPCAWNTDGFCDSAGQYYYGVWSCPGSQAETFATCTAQQTERLCKKTRGCTFQQKECQPTFLVNMQPWERFGWLNSWGAKSRLAWGCCQGSEAAYLFGGYCSNFGSDTCAQQPGCFVSEALGGCTMDATYKIKLLLGTTDANAIATISMVDECAAVTDRDTCNNYKPVKVKNSLVQQYMNSYYIIKPWNPPVDSSVCLLPSY